MDTPLAAPKLWPVLLGPPIVVGSIVGAVVLRDDWLSGREVECMLVWLAWSVACFLVLRRLEPDRFRKLVLSAVPFGFANLCAGVAHDHALLGDTMLAHLLAAGAGYVVEYGALAWAMARSDARLWSARRRGGGRDDEAAAS